MFYWLRIIALMFIDALLVALAIYVSLLLRFDGPIDPRFIANFQYAAPLFAVLVVACLFFSRLYHRLWKYASTGELLSIIRAVTIAILLGVLAIYSLDLPYLPRSVYIMSAVAIIALIGGSRLGWRVIRDMLIIKARQSLGNALIIGAGDGGAVVARELKHNTALGLDPIGFVDDDALKQKMSIYGVEVLGRRQDIPRLVKQHEIEEIIIAMPSASGRAIRELLEICRSTPARVRIFNGTGEIMHSNELRTVEMEDLLRREPVQLNNDEIASYISGRTILVSGAGGSIGSELCRQIAAFNPSRLVLLDNSENSLFEIEMELRNKARANPDPKAIANPGTGDLATSDPAAASQGAVNPAASFLSAELADIKLVDELDAVFARHRPQVIFHAAAYKHVPMMEQHPEQAFKNNVLGTRNMAEMAQRYQAETFVLVSTDKAVNPTSVMGASKRLAEQIVQSYNGSTPTHYAAVRFGNVLGSKGSVVPIFKRQIEQGGPVTVTDPEMTRYFMTIPEASGLIIQAGALARGGEIFVLDMGEPVKIVNLAEDLIRLAGLEPGRDIPIKFIGLRPGEKLHEELFSSQEQLGLTRHEQIFVLNNGDGRQSAALGKDGEEANSRKAAGQQAAALERLWKGMLAGLT